MQYIIEKYGLFFSVKVIHPWFKDGICPYLTIEPDETTLRSFRNMHLISRYHLGELRVMGLLTGSPETDRWTSESLGRNRFTFLMKLTDYSFFEVTKLDVTGFPGQVLYFTNTEKSLKLSINKCMLVDRLLTVPFEKGKTPKQVTLSTQNDVELMHQDMEKSAPAFKFDMSGQKSGLYKTFLQFSKADNRQAVQIYFDPQARRSSILGVIELLPGEEIRPAKEGRNMFTIPFETVE